MASAYSLGSCRASTRLPRDPNVFTVRRATRFSCGVDQSNITGSMSAPVRKHVYVQSCNAQQFADLLYRAFRHRFRRGAVTEDTSRGIFVVLTPPSDSIRIVRRDAIICVRNGCDPAEVLDALNDRCGKNECWDENELEFIANWWLTGSGNPQPSIVDPYCPRCSEKA